jgi:hypothetical protein
MDGWRVRRRSKIFGIAAKVIGDPGQLRVFENLRPRHHGKLSPIGVVFAAVMDALHVRFSLSSAPWKLRRSGMKKLHPRYSMVLVCVFPFGVSGTSS